MGDLRDRLHDILRDYSNYVAADGIFYEGACDRAEAMDRIMHLFEKEAENGKPKA